jgi:hypothetical protein
VNVRQDNAKALYILAAPFSHVKRHRGRGVSLVTSLNR